MTLRNVGLVLGKEVREALRDRRTLFVTLVLPILLYPLLMIGLGTATARQKGKLREAVQSYALAGPVPTELAAALEAEEGLAPLVVDDPEAALREGRVRLVVRAGDDLPPALAGEGTGTLELLHDSAAEPSAEARRKALAVVTTWERGLLDARLEARGLGKEFVNPVQVPAPSDSDVASATRRGAHLFGRILSMMLVIMVVTGAFTPAVDTVSGEKERGTMETLLVSPATRLEIVLGKFLAVFAVSLATALGNLVAMALTFGQFASTIGMRSRVDFELGIGTAATIFAVLIPLAALFSALALALSTLARSSKEAQTYLTPLMLVAMPLAMVSVVPNIELTLGLAATPVAGAVLLFRDLMLAQGEPALLSGVLLRLPVVLGSTLLAAGLSLRWAAWMFEREEVLFRDAGEPFSWKDLRPARREGARPGPGGAVLLPAVALAITFLLSQVFVTTENAGSPWVVAFQQAVLLGSVVAAIAIGGLDFRACLGWFRGGAGAWAAALLVGIGAPLATPWVMEVTGLAGGEDLSGSAALIEHLVRSLGVVPLVLLLAVLPATAEELLFRGWTLRGFRMQMSGTAAVVLSAVMFGAFHLDPTRILVTGALGCALGLIALRGGSVFPGILAHALHNGISVVLAQLALEGGEAAAAELPAVILSGSSVAWGAGGLVLVAVGVAVAARLRAVPTDSLPPGAPTR